VCRRSDGRRVALKRNRIIHLFYIEGNKDHQLGTGFFLHKRIISAVRRLEFASDNIKRSLLQYYCSECPHPMKG
jgi:hypothetical protein